MKNNINIDKSEVLRYMGYKGQEIEPELENSIDNIIDMCMDAAEPKYTYGYFDLDWNGDEVSLAGAGIVLPGKDMARHLYGAKYCAIMAVTLGMSIERKLMLLEKTSMTEAVILDSAANACIESVADYAEGLIIEESRQKGLYTNYRYSPGYGDFPIEAQQKLIPLLNCEKRIGLTVTGNSIMIPRKSVTAIIGIFDKEQIEKKKGCEGCNLYHTCKIRKGGGKCAEK